MLTNKIFLLLNKALFYMVLLFLFVSFISYNPQDSAINIVNDYAISNLGGSIGAFIADFFFEFFGFATIAFFITIVNGFYSQQITKVKYALCIMAFINSYICAMYYQPVDENWLYVNYAGLSSLLIYNHNLHNFDKYANYIVHYCFVIFCICNFFLCIPLVEKTRNFVIFVFSKNYQVVRNITFFIYKMAVYILKHTMFSIYKILFFIKYIYQNIFKQYILLLFKKNILKKKINFHEEHNENASDTTICKDITADKISENTKSSCEEQESTECIDDIDYDSDQEENTYNEDVDLIEEEELISDVDIYSENRELSTEIEENIDNKHNDAKYYDDIYDKYTDSNENKFNLPSLHFLDNNTNIVHKTQKMIDKSTLLENVLSDFGVKGKIINVSVGPVVTLYELQPEAGTKSARVIALAGDIARSMSAISARIDVISGKNAIGIELPNENRHTVYLKELFTTEQYASSQLKLPIALGHSIDGKPVIVDLAKMPHLLVAGTTGAGKSVAINAMILSLLYKLTPEQCRFIMIDPKMLELSVYNNIPNLLTPVVTEPKKAVIVLKWLTQEMERRYKLMSIIGVRNIGGYNSFIENDKSKGDQIEKKVLRKVDQNTGEKIFEYVTIDRKTLPFIVVIVDEMADLMVVAGKEIEASLQRLAQMARASGIHIIMATQRPSVDVITGVIKANFPTRISFAVSSRIDSRTILGTQGAEQLLGKGDMLYMSPGKHTKRIHGPFVSDAEVRRIVEYLNSQFGDQSVDDVLSTYVKNDTFGINNTGLDVDEEYADELFDHAVQIVLKEKKTSISYIQRRLKIGFNRAASLIETMESKGILGPQQNNGKRDILVSSVE